MPKESFTAGRLLEMSGSYWQTCAFHAGVTLDIFTKIGNDQCSSDTIAQEVNGDPRAMAMLLNALTAMGLLKKTDQGYQNIPSGRDLLCKTAPGYIGHMVKHHHNLMASWSRLDEAVLTGTPVRDRVVEREDEERENFLMGMFNIAMAIAPNVSKQIDLSGRKNLLDLGGGPGTYAIHFCLENPDLKATVYDLPSTRPYARKTINKFGLASRIDFMEGDYLSDRLGGSYDVIWLSHILHAEGLGDCQRVINKAVSVAAPGGMLIIHDFILNNTMDGPRFPALFSLNMLLGTKYGQSYSQQQIESFMSRAGLQDIKRLSFRGPTDSGIMVGMVPQVG